MKTDDKWLLFKQFLHNEMYISKDDIREWVHKSCEDIARRMVEQEFENFNLKTLIAGEVRKTDFYGTQFKDRVYTELSKQLIKKLELKIK